MTNLNIPPDPNGVLSDEQRLCVRRHHGIVIDLPPSEEGWTRKELHLAAHEIRKIAVLCDAIRQNEYQPTIWRLKPAVEDYLEDGLEHVTWTPCGCSTGVRTLEVGEIYTCCNDRCNVRFDRATAENVLGGQT
jgi:hypothetical protein